MFSGAMQPDASADQAFSSVLHAPQVSGHSEGNLSKWRPCSGSSADRQFISKARFSPGSVSARVNWLSVLSPEDFIFHAFDLV